MSHNKSMLFATPITACRLCDGVDLKMVFELAPTPAGDHYLPKNEHPEQLRVFPLDLHQCGSCGHVQLGAVVDPSYLYRDYIYTTSSSIGLAEHFKNYALSTAEKLSLKPGSLVVEIGSNDGTMLQAFKNIGMRVLGIDPAKEIACKATESGIPTIPEFFSSDLAERILVKHGAAQLVIANNVMANVASPQSTVTAIRQLLDPDGVFVFETGYLRYLAEDCVFDNIYHEHIDYYAIKPLVHFFDSLGMRIFDVYVSDSKGSSIRCSVSMNTAHHSVLPVVGELCIREENLLYQTPAPYRKLAARLSAIKASLHEILDAAKTRGDKIAGFGASVGITTMLYQFDLAPFLSHLVDDNSNRHHLSSPGLGLPVYSPEFALDKSQTDMVLLLAWRYLHPIMKKHGHHRHKGIRFLKVLPDVEEISA